MKKEEINPHKACLPFYEKKKWSASSFKNCSVNALGPTSGNSSAFYEWKLRHREWSSDFGNIYMSRLICRLE